MGRHEDGHQFLEELLTGAVVGEEGISVHVVEVALVRVGATSTQLVDLLSCLQAQEVIQPLFNWIVDTVTNWLVKGYFLKDASRDRDISSTLILLVVILWSLSVLFSELVDKLEG